MACFLHVWRFSLSHFFLCFLNKFLVCNARRSSQLYTEYYSKIVVEILRNIFSRFILCWACAVVYVVYVHTLTPFLSNMDACIVVLFVEMEYKHLCLYIVAIPFARIHHRIVLLLQRFQVSK